MRCYPFVLDRFSPHIRGDTLGSVLSRAGSLTDLAFPKGAVFTRASLQERERQHLEDLASVLEASLARSSTNKIQDPEEFEAITISNQLIARVQDIEPAGRLVIDLPRLLAESGGGGRSDHDVTLVDGDAIYVPPALREVSVLGEVFFPTSHAWLTGFNAEDYVNLSGGFTERSDTGRVYVVRANGAVVPAKKLDSKKWSWSSTTGDGVLPGDTVIVPLETDRYRKLELWQALSGIVFQMGVTAAQLKSAFDGSLNTR